MSAGGLSRAGRWMLVAVVAVLVALFGYDAWAVARAKARTPQALASMAARPVRLKDLPPSRVTALLRVEDPGFYRHHGVDFETPGQGLTTITQSLVKHLYFDRFHPGFAKIEQSLIARFVLDPAMSKADQLEAYINYSRLGSADGREIVGFGEAARVYYGKPLGRLTDREFLSLVAMNMAPATLDPRRHAAANAERVDRIQRLLAGACRPQSPFDVTYPDCARPRAPWRADTAAGPE